MDKNDCKILIGRNKICEHLEIGKDVFYSLVDEGLPARQLKSGRWVAHIGVIEAWFAEFTQAGAGKKRKSMLGPDPGGTPRNSKH